MNALGGPLSLLLSLPVLIAAALLAGALIRTGHRTEPNTEHRSHSTAIPA